MMNTGASELSSSVCSRSISLASSRARWAAGVPVLCSWPACSSTVYVQRHSVSACWHDTPAVVQPHLQHNPAQEPSIAMLSGDFHLL